MAELAPSPVTGKRPLQVSEPLPSDEEPPAKRPCIETPSPSAHLTLLEGLYDLEGDDAESCLDASFTAAATEEDLVAEMMKSLEKVIEEGGSSRGSGEASTSHLVSEALSPALASDQPSTSVLDIACTSDPYDEAADYEASSHGKLYNNEEFDTDLHLRQILQVSDDELGIPLSSSSSDLEDDSFHQEWAFLSEQGGAPAAYNFSWLDAPLQQFEEARELYEPVSLF